MKINYCPAKELRDAKENHQAKSILNEIASDENAGKMDYQTVIVEYDFKTKVGKGSTGQMTGWLAESQHPNNLCLKSQQGATMSEVVRDHLKVATVELVMEYARLKWDGTYFVAQDGPRWESYYHVTSV